MQAPGEMKRLYRSRNEKILAGVCGGFASYFSVDSGIVRLGFLLLTLITGVFPGVIVYVIAAMILPEGPQS